MPVYMGNLSHKNLISTMTKHMMARMWRHNVHSNIDRMASGQCSKVWASINKYNAFIGIHKMKSTQLVENADFTDQFDWYYYAISFVIFNIL